MEPRETFTIGAVVHYQRAIDAGILFNAKIETGCRKCLGKEEAFLGSHSGPGEIWQVKQGIWVFQDHLVQLFEDESFLLGTVEGNTVFGLGQSRHFRVS